MDDFDKFFRNGKISEMLKYIPGLAKAAYEVNLKKEKERENLQMILIKVKK